MLSGPEPPELICSSGFCGGLAEGLAVGDIVLADAILGENKNERHAVEFEPGLDALRLALAGARIRYHVGAVVSVKAAVTKPAEKRRLGVERGAIAVDMESFAMAETVLKQDTEHKIQDAGCRMQDTGRGDGNPRSSIGNRESAMFLLRVVSDAVGDELPEEVGTFLDEEGRVRVGSVARYALGGPGKVKKLLEMKRNVEKAAKRLTAAWRAALPQVRNAR